MCRGLPFAALVILPLERDAILVFEGSTRGRSTAQATTWIEDTRPCRKIAETWVAALAEKHFLGAAIGLAGLRRMMPYDQWDLFSAAVTGAKAHGCGATRRQSPQRQVRPRNRGGAGPHRRLSTRLPMISRRGVSTLPPNP
ncbi:MAG: hypothetical protein ABSB35_36155 [Bryobacteraceae bacterium]